MSITLLKIDYFKKFWTLLNIICKKIVWTIESVSWIAVVSLGPSFSKINIYIPPDSLRSNWAFVSNNNALCYLTVTFLGKIIMVLGKDMGWNIFYTKLKLSFDFFLLLTKLCVLKYKRPQTTSVSNRLDELCINH